MIVIVRRSDLFSGREQLLAVSESFKGWTRVLHREVLMHGKKHSRGMGRELLEHRA